MNKSYTKGTVKLVTISKIEKGMPIVYTQDDCKEVLELTRIKKSPCDYLYWLGIKDASAVWTNDIHQLKELVVEFEGKEKGLPKKKGDRFFLSSDRLQQELVWNGKLSEFGVGTEGGGWVNPTFVQLPVIKQISINKCDWKDILTNDLINKEVKFRFEPLIDKAKKPSMTSMAKIYISPGKPDWDDLFNQYEIDCRDNKYPWGYNDWLAENYNPPIKK